MTISLPIIEEKYLIDPINTPSTYRIAQKFKSLENIQDSSWKFETELYLGKYMFYLFHTSQVYQLICFLELRFEIFQPILGFLHDTCSELFKHFAIAVRTFYIGYKDFGVKIRHFSLHSPDI